MQHAGHLERGQLEQRRGQVTNLDRAADLVLVEGHRRVECDLLVLRRREARPTDDQRRPHDECGRVRSQNARLGLRLRAPVLGDRARRVVLDVRHPLPPVEDHIRREMDEPRAHLARRTRNVLGAIDRRLPRPVAVLPVRGVDHDPRPEPAQQRTHCNGVSDIDTLACRARRLAKQLGAEIAGCARDLKPGAETRTRHEGTVANGRKRGGAT